MDQTRARWLHGALLLCLTAGCAADPQPQAGVEAGKSADYALAGPHPVGHVDFTSIDAARKRSLRLTLWYPAAASAAAAAKLGTPLADFASPGAERDALTPLLAKAPPGCTRQTLGSALAAPPLLGKPWPLVLFSHCHGCTRFSSAALAERLASHGIAVLAVDHAGNTLYDALAGKLGGLDAQTLQTRVADVRHALDLALDPTAAAVPEAVRGRLDAGQVGALGHSFGGVTAARLAQTDPRVKAVAAIAVPMQNPLLPGVDLQALYLPLLFVLAQEDNSIGEAGNFLILKNFADANPPAWLIEVATAGHFSFFDLAGLVPAFAAGCGEGKSMADDEPFTYLDNAVARGIGQRVVTGFFAAHLRGELTGLGALEAEVPAGTVFVSVRN